MIRSLRFTPAPGRLSRGGLLGWASFELDGTWHLDGVAVRRTLQGKVALAFPSRRDRYGIEHAYLRPTSARAWHEIEAAVLAELGLEAGPVALPVPREEPRATSRRARTVPSGAKELDP